MKKVLTLNLIAAALLAVQCRAAEPATAISQLEGLLDPQESAQEFPMPDPGPGVDPLEFPGMPHGNSTEDCYMYYGTEVCISPNWPDCSATAGVEPCIDHVQPDPCGHLDLPVWVSFHNGGQFYQGCSGNNFDPLAAARGGKAELRQDGQRLVLTLGGGKIYFSRGGKKAKAAPASARVTLQDMLDNAPCGGLMACGQPGIDPAIIEAAVAEITSGSSAQWDLVQAAPAQTGGVRLAK